ncbi:imidazolonepropionase [Longilinea arvoryzae]|uniref:Imidazolonepropionase n=1 Tax=Longilinea arvoryzae TaxID=360412 RepID=A0A0S7B8K5_9CHLR|nr:amidohydrolase family protein [Longilinea arvoryzae]GAP13852.1 imidazolonepropionase [Longilinea arvoryzae]
MSNWTKILLLCSLLLSACQTAPVSPVAPTPAVLAVTNGSLWDGSQLVPDGVLVIRDGIIEAAGTADQVAIPAGTQMIDANGGAILPGLIDDHVHNAAEPEVRRKFLEAGVTTLCDTGAGAIQLREYRSTPPSTELISRVYYSGPFLSAPGGYPSDTDASARLEVGSTEEAVRAVQRLAAEGVSYIKVALDDGRGDVPLPVLSEEVLRAIVAEAHRQGLSVRAHVLDAGYINLALDAGVDAVEHIPAPEFSRQVFELWMRTDKALQLPQTYLDQLKRLADSGAPLTPTLEVLERRTCNTVAQSDAERSACVRVYVEAVRQFHQMGGVIAFGNDYGSAGMAAGLPWHEMELLQQAGLSNAEILTAATTTAARVCGHADELGALQPGRIADVLIVNGNPLDDLTALQRVQAVILGGQVVGK